MLTCVCEDGRMPDRKIRIPVSCSPFSRPFLFPRSRNAGRSRRESRVESRRITFHAPAGSEFDFILRGYGSAAKLRAFDRIPGDRARPIIVRFFLSDLPRVGRIFARRDVFELERAVAANIRFGVTPALAACAGIECACNDEGDFVPPSREPPARSAWPRFRDGHFGAGWFGARFN